MWVELGKSFTFALDFFCGNGDIMLNGIRFDAFAKKKITHAKEDDIHCENKEHFF